MRSSALATLLLGAGLGLLAGAPAAAWTPSDGEVLSFEVLRNGRAFGRHEVTFAREGERVGVDVDIDLRVKLGPITAFRYEHDVAEQWVDGRLQSLSSQTLKDGERFSLSVAPAGEELAVDGVDFAGRVEPTIVPTTYWNIDLLSQAAMLNSETGEMLPITVESLGEELIEAAGGQIAARRYRIHSEIVLDLWYDAEGRWVKCAFTTRGSDVEYVLE